ncbi:MAG: PLP-dependent aminotransferase family protein [Erysipelotrichaceae bacterium]|nr:PLP-dependent aminotransferase family protein [Erysipelotrichaceae bacterium]
MNLTALHLMKQKQLPLYQQIYESIRKDILDGFIHPGDRLPSLRDAAEQLKVSRTSIERAYEQLQLEGFLQASPKRGYFVSVTEDDIRIRRRILTPPSKTEYRPKYDFRSLSVDVQNFDSVIWKRYMRDILEQQKTIYSYGSVEGEWELRTALQQYLYSNCGVIADIEQILIGASFQTLLSLICGMLEKSAVIGMEKNSFLKAQQIFQDYHFPVICLDFHNEAELLEQLRSNHITLFYCHSASFGETKAPISEAYRNVLLTWADQEDTWILEDNHNGEIAVRTQVHSAMQGFDRHHRILYFGSFSKLLLPSLRIAYMVIPPYFLDKFKKRRQYYNASASKIEQLALARYISDGHLERHVRRLRRQYEKKSILMEKLLQEFFSDIPYRLNRAGLCYHIFTDPAYFPRIMQECHKIDMIVKCDDTSIILSFAAVDEKTMRTAIPLLRKQFNKVIHQT